MDKPVDINKFRKQKRQTRAKHNTLCQRGLHKWKYDEGKQFDVKLGKLVSIQRCQRCAKQRTIVS